LQAFVVSIAVEGQICDAALIEISDPVLLGIAAIQRLFTSIWEIVDPSRSNHGPARLGPQSAWPRASRNFDHRPCPRPEERGGGQA
jgi:hypothetical protein